MIRLATIEDAPQLFRLNEQFNGKGVTTLERIEESLLTNSQETVVVAEIDGVIAGFVCIRIKSSFCYSENYAEISEVYVHEKYRRQKIASRMIEFSEEYCMRSRPLHNFELKTGEDNLAAQALYSTLGYHRSSEIILSKRRMDV